jgi:aminoglycoside phosphotransferase (APT) family kinase protein
VWPAPDDRDVDLNRLPETAWLGELGRAARIRLAATRASDPVIGHCDWESHNLEFRRAKPWAVHDWDSVVCAAETVIAGVAAAMWPAGSESAGAGVGQSEAFLDAYQEARGVAFSPNEIEETWAAGTWIRAFNAKKFLLDGLDTLSPAEAAERARRARLRLPHGFRVASS